MLPNAKSRGSFRAKKVVSPPIGRQSNSHFISGTGLKLKMASALGWYGPLIDLSRASSHFGDFVQLLLFVLHRSTPLQITVCNICGDAGREDLLVLYSRCSDGAELMHKSDVGAGLLHAGSEWPSGILLECVIDPQVEEEQENLGVSPA
ncbi:hypothetical protein K1719_031186 [Acacia pycnantha]|nr:hypothetical protein K1719_031186 [Acacia pycnantha]